MTPWTETDDLYETREQCRHWEQRADELHAEVELLQSIIRKQMSPTEISQRLAEANELSDAYVEQAMTIKELRAEVERLTPDGYLNWKDRATDLENENNNLHAEIERLRAREREALEPKP